MPMPKITFEELTERLKSLSGERQQIEEIVESLKEEQGPEFIIAMIIGMVVNPECVRGVLACYLTLREKLEKQQLEELEKLYGK